MRPPRWLLFGLAMSSLVLLTYAGVLLAFSVEVPDEMAAANPTLTAGHRAIVVPIGDPAAVATAAANATPEIILRGETNGSLPNAAGGLRAGEALTYVPAGANGTVEVGNLTIDLGLLSGGAEGWALKGQSEAEPWFVPKDEALGVVARVESPARIGMMFALGGLGFITPLLLVVATHRATRGERKGAPMAVCRECRAPMPPNAEFCMRCGAWTKPEMSG